MPDFWGTERKLNLEGGKAIEVLFDPKKSVETKETSDYGTRYIFTFLKDGKSVKMEAGARLYDAIAEAIGEGNTEPKKLRIAAHGKRGTTDYGFDVSVVS